MHKPCLAWPCMLLTACLALHCLALPVWAVHCSAAGALRCCRNPPCPALPCTYMPVPMCRVCPPFVPLRVPSSAGSCRVAANALGLAAVPVLAAFRVLSEASLHGCACVPRLPACLQGWLPACVPAYSFNPPVLPWSVLCPQAACLALVSLALASLRPFVPSELLPRHSRYGY